MKVDQLCMNCMADRGNIDQPDERWRTCSQCGMDDRHLSVVSNGIEPGTVMNNRYVVGRAMSVDPLGQGYLSYDLVLHRKVVVQTLPLAKARSLPTVIAQLISMPGAVPVYDAFQQDQVTFIVNEWIAEDRFQAVRAGILNMFGIEDMPSIETETISATDPENDVRRDEQHATLEASMQAALEAELLTQNDEEDAVPMEPAVPITEDTPADTGASKDDDDSGVDIPEHETETKSDSERKPESVPEPLDYDYISRNVIWGSVGVIAATIIGLCVWYMISQLLTPDPLPKRVVKDVLPPPQKTLISTIPPSPTKPIVKSDDPSKSPLAVPEQGPRPTEQPTVMEPSDFYLDEQNKVLNIKYKDRGNASGIGDILITYLKDDEQQTYTTQGDSAVILDIDKNGIPEVIKYDTISELPFEMDKRDIIPFENVYNFDLNKEELVLTSSNYKEYYRDVILPQFKSDPYFNDSPMKNRMIQALEMLIEGKLEPDDRNLVRYFSSVEPYED